MIKHRLLARLFYAPYDNLIWRYPAADNRVYLTFDDGPYPPVTRPLLEMLNGFGIPATFFLSGENLFHYRHQLAVLDYRGHRIGNHLYHHIPLFGLSARQLLKQVHLTDQLIYRQAHCLPTLFRPPYGVFSPQLFAALKGTAKKLILWSLMANDFKWKREKVIAHLLKSVQAGDIIVFHDSPQTEKILFDVLPPLIEHVKNKGWTFGALS